MGIVNIPTESTSGWEQALSELKERGLKKVHLFVSNGLKSLENAISSTFNKSVHQKCIVPLIRNILAKVRTSHKSEIAEYFRFILEPNNKNYTKEKALERLKLFSVKWGKLYRHIKILPKKEDINYYFNYLNYGYRIRRMIYTTNWIERFKKSCKRTIKIGTHFVHQKLL